MSSETSITNTTPMTTPIPAVEPKKVENIEKLKETSKDIIDSNDEIDLKNLYKMRRVWEVAETISAFIAEPLCGASIVGNIYVTNVAQADPIIAQVLNYIGIIGVVFKGVWLFMSKKRTNTITMIENEKDRVINQIKNTI